MARSPRLKSDAKRARPHEAGAEVLLLQVLVHDPIGAIGITGPMMAGHARWAEHHEEALIAFGEFVDIKRRVLELPHEADGSAMRTINDEEFVSEVYRTGTRAVLSAVLALQHLTSEIEFTTKAPLGTLDPIERIATAVCRVGFESHAAMEGWEGLLKVWFPISVCSCQAA